MSDDDVRAAYVGRWGPPSRTARFQVDENSIEVYKWDAAVNPEQVALYATIGASSEPVAGQDPDHRLEFFIGLLPPKDDVASALAALGLYAQREGESLDHGHTVPSDGPLWAGTELNRFLVVRPRTAVLEPIRLPNGQHVELLQAIPMYESELEYKRRHGTDGLLQRWEEASVPFWDPDRPATSL
jgi:hypothetical protein